jgi:hypothetical protein
VATPQIILNYASFLEEHAYFEVGRSGDGCGGMVIDLGGLGMHRESCIDARLLD